MGMPSAMITRETKPVFGGLGGGIGIPSATITREAKPVFGGLGGGMGMPSAMIHGRQNRSWAASEVAWDAVSQMRAIIPNRYS